MLKFYDDEANKKYNDISGYYIEKEKFDKIKASFDSKSPGQRKQQDIDQYNGAVKSFNEATNKYNKTNSELNNTRTQLLNNWNEAGARFTDKHVPKNK